MLQYVGLNPLKSKKYWPFAIFASLSCVNFILTIGDIYFNPNINYMYFSESIIAQIHVSHIIILI